MFESFLKKTLHGSFVNGVFVTDGPSIPHPSLPLKKDWKSLALASPQLVDQALKYAQEGQAEIEKMSCYERSELLKSIAEKLKSYASPLAEIIAHEMGKTIKDGKG